MPALSSTRSTSNRREAGRAALRSTRGKMASSNDQAGSNSYVLQDFCTQHGLKEDNKVSSLENAFDVKNNMRESTRYFLKPTKSEHQQQSGSILVASNRPRTRLQPGSVFICSSVIYFGIHGHSHCTFQQVQQMQLVAMDIDLAFRV